MFDSQNLEVNTELPSSISAINTFVDSTLSYDTKYKPILKVAEVDPKCIMVGTMVASLMMWLETGESPKLALTFLKNC